MDDKSEDMRYDAAYRHALSRTQVLTEAENFARYAIETQRRVSIPHAWVLFRGGEK